MKQARSVRDECSMSSGIQAGHYSRSTALLEAYDTTTSILAQVRLNPQPELKVNELSARRKEIKAIELERCLMSSECISWLQHVYPR